MKPIPIPLAGTAAAAVETGDGCIHESGMPTELQGHTLDRVIDTTAYWLGMENQRTNGFRHD